MPAIHFVLSVFSASKLLFVLCRVSRRAEWKAKVIFLIFQWRNNKAPPLWLWLAAEVFTILMLANSMVEKLILLAFVTWWRNLDLDFVVWCSSPPLCVEQTQCADLESIGTPFSLLRKVVHSLKLLSTMMWHWCKQDNHEKLVVFWFLPAGHPPKKAVYNLLWQDL